MLQNALPGAIEKLSRLVAQCPDHAEALSDLSYALAAHGQSTHDASMQEESLTCIRRAVELTPDSTDLRNQLINALSMHRRVSEQLSQARAWHARSPDSIDAITALAAAYQESCLFDEARVAFQQALARFPGDYQLASMFAQFSNYDPGHSPADRFDRHRAAAACLQAHAAPPARHSNDRSPTRKLRVGFISGDFRVHSCMYFFEPLLRHLDRAQFDVYLYSTYQIEDHVTARLKPLAKGFRRSITRPGTSEGLGFKIWNDRIDILIDLAGYSPGNRLHVMHARPAPVQATYLGYPNTTGETAIDYRIVDSHTDPAGADSLASETLFRLDPCFLVYAPPEVSAPTGHEPRREITFASFNNGIKTNPPTVALWAGVLGAVPGSTLLLKGGSFGQPEFRERILAQFASHHVAPDRVRFAPSTPDQREHFATYDTIDVALDPLVYCGTTTTCDALWMGAPVVTHAGDCHAGRVGVSLLHAIGHPEWIARTPEEYVTIAAQLASDSARRAELRHTLRPRVAASPLCDAPGYALRFGHALRAMWESWCTHPRAEP